MLKSFPTILTVIGCPKKSDFVQLGPSPKLKLEGGPKHNTKFALSHPPPTHHKPRQAKTSQDKLNT
jgi:hypothetical protein